MSYTRILQTVFPVLLASVAFAQQGVLDNSPNRPIGTVDGTNLPVQPIGHGDLLGVRVYDAPEVTGSFRVLDDGTIRMPMLKEKIQVLGLLPADVETLIANELKSDQLLVDPFVTVTILDYHSRPISVSGAVKNPTIFQAIGDVTLLDALAKAGGVSDQAGGELVITRPNGEGGAESIQRVPVRALIERTDPSLNVKLKGGETISVPAVSTIIVSGNVVESGVFPVQDSGTSTVLTAIGQAKGLGQYRPKKAYIFRADPAGTKHEIEVDLKGILERKSPDVVLQARDLLYVPANRRGEITAQMVTILSGVGAASASAIIVTRNQGF